MADGAFVINARAVSGFEGFFLGEEFSQGPVFGPVGEDQVLFDSSQGPAAVGGQGLIFCAVEFFPEVRAISLVHLSVVRGPGIADMSKEAGANC